MITNTGWNNYNIWEHSSTVKELYKKRCLLEIEEMVSHAQAIELLAPHINNGDTLLDVGCGSGYFYHSIKSRNIPVEYFGIDATDSLINIGKDVLPEFGLSPERLQTIRIEDMDGEMDHVVCINVLSNLDNFHRPLERMLLNARKTVILRESFQDLAEYHYVTDKYLDKNLKVHVNTYPRTEVKDFFKEYGFEAEFVLDKYTSGQPQSVIDYPHYWEFVVAKKNK